MPQSANQWEQYAEKPAAGASDFEQYAEKPPEPHPISDFAGNFLQQINPMPGIKAALTDFPGTIKGLVGAQVDQGRQAAQHFHQGDYSEAFGHGLAAALPLVGPAAANAGEQIGQGDVAGGLGSAAGIMAGMAAPAAIKGIGQGLSHTAEPLAESANGIRKLDRAYQRTPGRAILDDTTGVRPGTIAQNAKATMGRLTPELEAKVKQGVRPFPNGPPAPASLQPALDVIGQGIDKAVTQNNLRAVNQINPMNAHLTQNQFTGAPIPQQLSPWELLQLKRGFGEQFFHPNPETLKGTSAVANRAYGALDKELDRTVPGAAELNQRISSLIPVAKRAESTDLNAPLEQRIIHRIAAHTGALTGAAAGYHMGGPLGGIIGLALPEMVASPTGQMIAARSLDAAGKGLQTPVAGMAGQAAPFITPRKKQEK